MMTEDRAGTDRRAPVTLTSTRTAHALSLSLSQPLSDGMLMAGFQSHMPDMNVLPHPSAPRAKAPPRLRVPAERNALVLVRTIVRVFVFRFSRK